MVTSSQLVGATVSHYRILRKIGGGGMSVVYEAEDINLGRHAALKFLPDELISDNRALDRFNREARAASALDHHNICTVYDVGEYDGKPFIAMQYLEGESLKEKIVRKALGIDTVVDLGVQIADALEAAHARGIIHRDVKPANIFVTNRGEAKVLDFGLAKLTLRAQTSIYSAETIDNVEHVHLTSSGTALGTVAYMSPEQVRGQELDLRTDLFSFGAVLYEMCTGTLPFRGDTSGVIFDSILNRIPVAPVRLNPDVPPEMERIIHKALEKDRNLRYQHAADMRTDLQRLKRDTDSKRVGFALSETTTVREVAVAGFRKLWTIVVPVLLVTALIVGAFYYRSHESNALTEQDSIVMADFTNTTGDAVFDSTLKLALTADLEQSPFLNIVSDKKIGDTLNLMGRKPGERISSQLAQEICLRVGSKAVLIGSIGNLGSHYIVGLRALSCQTGDSLGTTEAEAQSREKVIESLDRAATALRKKLGESLASIQKFDKPLQGLTTSSLEALEAYTAATKPDAGNNLVPLLRQAIELDPNFALAYASLGTTYSSMGQASLAIANFKRAYELRERVSEAEKFYIATQYFTYVTGEVDKAIQQYQLWIQVYPQSSIAHLNLAPDYAILGHYERAAAESREAKRIEPTLEAYVNLGGYYVFLNRLDEAKATFNEAAARGFEHPYLRLVQYYLAFAQNNNRAMQAEVAEAAGKPDGADLLLSTASDTEAFYGRLRKARELSRQAVESAKRSGAGEAAALWQASAALREAELGNNTEAIKQIGTALALSSGHDVQLLTALVLARSGQAARAQVIIQKLSEESPQSTVLQGYWGPVIRAQIELSKGSAAKAIETLEDARPYELGEPPPFQPATMYPIYLRGQAYLAARRGKDAATEFQKILDRRTAVLNFPLGALAQLSLARAYAAWGDSAKSRTAYQDFLALWKDADSNLPILRDARTEYAKQESVR